MTISSGARVSREAANVLVVDDTKENLVAFAAALESPRLNVLTAASAEDALRQLLRADVATVLLDVAMPQMDGYELAALIRARERFRHVPIVMITAFAHDAEQEQRGFEAGADDYLRKPISPELLRAKVLAMVQLCLAAEQHRIRAFGQLARERARAAQLRAAAADDDALLREVAFALRTPLTALKLHVQRALISSAEPRSAFGRHLHCADVQASRMRDVLDQVCEVWEARIASGPRQPVAFQFEDALLEILRGFSRRAALTQPLSLRGGAFQVHWDRALLQAMVAGMLRYALEAAPDSPLIVEVEKGPSGVRLAVHDFCGPDRPSSHPPHSEQVHRSGAALHFAVADRAARAMGGRVELGAASDPAQILVASLRG